MRMGGTLPGAGAQEEVSKLGPPLLRPQPLPPDDQMFRPGTRGRWLQFPACDTPEARSSWASLGARGPSFSQPCPRCGPHHLFLCSQDHWQPGLRARHLHTDHCCFPNSSSVWLRTQTLGIV